MTTDRRQSPIPSESKLREFLEWYYSAPYWIDLHDAIEQAYEQGLMGGEGWEFSATSDAGFLWMDDDGNEYEHIWS